MSSKKRKHLVETYLGSTDPLLGAHQDCFVISRDCAEIRIYSDFRNMAAFCLIILKQESQKRAERVCCKLNCDTWNSENMQIAAFKCLLSSSGERGLVHIQTNREYDFDPCGSVDPL